MRMKYLAGLMVVLLFCITVPARACCEGDPPGNPACYECKDGVWVLKASAECGRDSDCPGICHICVNCLCVNDDSKCNTNQCCIDGNCVDPICDNCHDPGPKWWYECGHTSDEDGHPCATDWCIRNCLTGPTCDYKGPEWPCGKSHCDTAIVIPLLPAIVQLTYVAPCAGGTTHFVPAATVMYGCWDDCNGIIYTKACEIFWCGGGTPSGVDAKGWTMECGCP